jgi:hypothetical protein
VDKGEGASEAERRVELRKRAGVEVFSQKCLLGCGEGVKVGLRS